MRATVRTAAINGVDAVPVEVQSDVSNGLPAFTIVGMADTAVQEARERVRSAVRAAGFEFPCARVVLNLAPAPLRKRGTGFDLPMAVAILIATGQLPTSTVTDAVLVGELALDGSVRSVQGLLAHAVAAIRHGLILVGPAHGSDGARALDPSRYRPVESLGDLRAKSWKPAPVLARSRPGQPNDHDLASVVGHETARRAIEVCAAGGHHLLLFGPPGSGKTLLARCLCGILPPMNKRERIESALIHSVSGLDECALLAGVRPFRSPHHSCSTVGLVGGGRPPRPGEASLAHNGLLFLDEINEFAPSALQTLRQPLEEASLTIVRAEHRVTYPARFTLVGAMNPCPCGFYGDPDRRCTCSDTSIHRHQSRIGGPLMDRIDMTVRVARVDPARIISCTVPNESSSLVRDRVLAAREFAGKRGKVPHTSLAGRRLMETCRLTTETSDSLSTMARERCLSGRGITRILRVARSIADLDASKRVTNDHVFEALSFRAWDAPGRS